MFIDISPVETGSLTYTNDIWTSIFSWEVNKPGIIWPTILSVLV